MARRTHLQALVSPFWERQAGETTKQYNYFVVYRDLGQNRTRSRVCEETKVIPQYVADLSRFNRWQERITAWEDHITRLDAERSAKTAITDRAKRRDSRMKQAQAFQNAGMSILIAAQVKGLPVGYKVDDKGNLFDAKGNPIDGLTVKEARTLLGAAVSFVRLGMDAERLEEGLATEVIGLVNAELQTILDLLKAGLSAGEYQRVFTILAAHVGLESEEPTGKRNLGEEGLQV